MDGTLVYPPSWRLSLATYYNDEQIKEAVMGSRCGTYGGKTEMRIRFWRVRLKERDRLEDLRLRSICDSNIKVYLNEI
jgi:hypothetical protein